MNTYVSKNNQKNMNKKERDNMKKDKYKIENVAEKII